jgi:peptidoglycan hydrolase-like protein with peptidoglycan-binding domain
MEWRDATMAFLNKGVGRSPRRGISLLLVFALIFTLVPCAFASSVGSSPSAVTVSSTINFVRLGKAVSIFTTDSTPTTGAVTVATGSVLMLVSTNTYTITVSSVSKEYGCLYYNNKRYNVLWSDVSAYILSAADLATYVTGTLWKVSTYPSLKRADNLLGNAEVYALQLALKTLGYYSSSLDGEYGENTETAVKAFQKAYSLTADGNAGPITLKVLYPLAITKYTGSSSTSTTTTSGTLVTKLSLNLRKSYAVDSARLAIVPAKTTLAYTNVATANGVTWYYVTYGTLNGWLMGTYVTASASSSSSSDTQLGTLTTLVKVNLRKSASSNAVRLALVPASQTLSYTKITTSGGVSWYYVTYNNLSGWLMGTYVSASGSSTSPTTGLGTVTITLKNTRVRSSANGSKTGYVLAKGTTATLLATPTTAGGYSWYYIKTSSGIKGYVRGDCATVSYDAGSGVTPSTTKTYVKLASSVQLFTSDEQSSTGAVTVPSGTVLQLVSTETYTKNGVVYCSLYYNNTRYNCVYGNVSGSIMSASALTTYITGTLWPAGYYKPLKEDLKITGDIYVHSLQYALTLLGYYTGALDGSFGSATTSAVRNFQRKYSLTVDGSAGKETSAILYPKAIAALTGTGSSDTGDFGTITSVTMAAWDFTNQGADLFPKGATATIMDVDTQMVFKVKRWSGAYHADCVPLTASDTKTMCDIVNFTYNSSTPTAAQLTKIKSTSLSDSNGGISYTWPDFNGKLTGVTSIGSKWDRRAALLNYNGKVYCVSIYGFPHGYGSYATCDAYAAGNHYYGMMCIHFKGSETHTSGAVDTQHQANIVKAYNFAKTKWPTLCK